MADFELPGFGGGGGEAKSRLPIYVALGGLALGLLIFRRRGGASPSSGGGRIDDSAVLEFAKVSAAAEGDMRQLTAANDIRRAELDLARANTPAGLRECYTGEQWRNLDKTSKDLIRHQAKRGGSAITPGPGGGVCVVPTVRGIEGDLQSVQRSKGGLFSSSSVGRGASAPPVPRPGVLDALDAYLGYRVATQRPQSGADYGR